MPLTPETRQAFRAWLIANDLQPEVADAILESMPPYDWSELVRRSDLARVEARLDRFEGRVDQWFERIDERFERIDERFERIDERFEHVGVAMSSLEGRVATMNDSINGRIDGLYNVMLWGFVTTIAMLVIGFVSLLGVGLAG